MRTKAIVKKEEQEHMKGKKKKGRPRKAAI